VVLRRKRVLLGDPAYDALTHFDWGTNGHQIWAACGAYGQVIAIVPEHRLV
jgi:hypothetical protein